MRSLLVLGLCLFTSIASAQRIHGDPQKAAYADPSEWPTTSGQCHWTSPTANMPGMPAHTHVDMKFPLYAELSQPFTVPVTITLFHTAGRISSLNDFDIAYSANGPQGFVLDPQFSFPLLGDINGVKVYTGHITFDPRLSTVVHGWHTFGLQLYTHYDNSRERLINKFRLPAYNVSNLSVPEQPPGDGTGIRMTSNCELRDEGAPADGNTSIWQSNVMEFLQILPVLGPITPGLPWKLSMNGYNYGATTNLPPGTLRIRVDPDLHNNIPGTIIFEQQGPDTTIRPYTFPDQSPEGTHKYMFQWERPDNPGTRDLTSLLVFNMTVGPGGVAQPPDLQPIPQPNPLTRTVPKVTGLTLSAAAAAITNADLVLGSVTQVTSATAPVGTVLTSSPAAGTKVNAGSSVNLTVSSGSSPPPRRVVAVTPSRTPSGASTR